ncbi:MAG TPA: DUF1232 domain-containing protein [Aeromicrobium sp.]|nr:DUF1232 domain-containing protein [Aeromicrobium sp.]
MWWQVAASLAGGLVLVWAVMVAVLYATGRRDPGQDQLKEALRFIPDLVRLLRRLVVDHTLPRGVRIRLGLLLAYLVMPIDLIPDFIPVVGYADDVLIVAIALRSVVRHAGVEALERHWSGTPEGLRVVRRLAGLAEGETR